jgi:hypothetical protein
MQIEYRKSFELEPYRNLRKYLYPTAMKFFKNHSPSLDELKIFKTNRDPEYFEAELAKLSNLSVIKK